MGGGYAPGAWKRFVDFFLGEPHGVGIGMVSVAPCVVKVDRLPAFKGVTCLIPAQGGTKQV